MREQKADELTPYILVEISHFMDWFGVLKGNFGEIAI